MQAGCAGGLSLSGCKVGRCTQLGRTLLEPDLWARPRRSRRNKPKIPLSLGSSPPHGVPRKSPEAQGIRKKGKEGKEADANSNENSDS